MDIPNPSRHPSSYRDPSGFLFYASGKLYRQINRVYQEHYTQLMASGLYEKLTSTGRLISHQEVNENLRQDPDWYKTIQPETIPLISYPYEWCFSQLQDAGLLTLSIMKEALEKGMILKDASAYNIQYRNAQPVFIDTLSFEKYHPEQPWVAYRQFCEQFLYPLYLEAYTGVPVSGWFRQYPDGIPAVACARLLPWKSRWNLGVRLHVLLPAALHKSTQPSKVSTAFSHRKMQHLIDHLENIVQGLKTARQLPGTWNTYYEETILNQAYLNEKAELIGKWITAYNNNTVLDLGANDGYFSMIAAASGHRVIAADMETTCINTLYQKLRNSPGITITALVMDIANPSPDWGFQHRERTSFSARAHADLLLALALIHHLAIGKNIPLPLIAGYFAGLAPRLIIEFIPREDEKVRAMLAGREQQFPDYTAAAFEKAFASHYQLEKREHLPGSGRVLYLMTRR